MVQIKNILTCLFLTLVLNGFAQEQLTTELRSNAKIHKNYVEIMKDMPDRPDTVGNPNLPSLSLPFKDEFNQRSMFPDSTKWVDKKVYINSGYSSDPLSVGVATFDGLDENGYPYNFANPISHGIADYLTSYPIDLHNKDSVYISFAYQPGGLGNEPEPEDSLVLEFYNPNTDSWNARWNVAGSAVHPFKKVILLVDSSYYHDKFQFRFKNYATLSGALDMWNIDFVHVAANRTYDDTTLYDLAFKYPPKSLINDYTSMPYPHYKADTTNSMKPNLDFTFRNNTSQTQNIFYKQKIYDSLGSQLDEYPTGGGTFFVINPYQSYTVNIPVKDNPRNFYFNSVNDCSNYYDISNYFKIGNGNNKDDWPSNDTVFQQQIFNPYYAYDDGSAEAAFGVQGSGADVALEFNANVKDTLRAIDIYYAPAVNDASGYTFHFNVWSSIQPENKLYTSSTVSTPKYTQINGFTRYYLDTPIILNGKFYIGWEKISAQRLNVGFDRNNDSHQKLYFNTGSGWANSSFKGSLMLHPVFGTCIPVQTKVKQLGIRKQIKLFPNPANNRIKIVGIPDKSTGHLMIYNMNGKKVFEKTVSQNTVEINTSSFPPNLYMIVLYNNKEVLMRKKIIISH